MKIFTKTAGIAALALAMTTIGAPQARAWGGGWPIAAGVVGGLAVGTAIGATLASASTPVYYAPPAPVYAAPTYYAPPAYAPAPVSVVAAPGFYAPRVVYARPYPYYYPYARVGYGWGARYYRGARGFYRR